MARRLAAARIGNVAGIPDGILGIYSAIGVNYSMKFKRNAACAVMALELAVQRAVRIGLLGLAVSALIPASLASAAGDAAAGGEKSYTCLGCHGVKHYVNTYPSYHVPRIAGQHEVYLISALQAYRAKTRSHPTMQANAALLSNQDIEDIAAWFAAQGAK